MDREEKNRRDFEQGDEVREERNRRTSEEAAEEDRRQWEKTRDLRREAEGGGAGDRKRRDEA